MSEVESRREFVAADGLASAAIAGLLFCAYLFTASLTFISGDELFLFDYTESLAKHGSVWRSETAELEWPGESTTEPLQPLLAAPLYWFVNNFDGIGNVHGTLLFNPLITALTGTLVFLYLRRLAFDRLTSIIAALAFGLTTLAWPYTKTFFREPLTVFLIFACAFCLLCLREAIRDNDRGKRIWFLLALITGLSGMLTKEAAVFGVPTVLLILLPLVMARLRAPRDWAILFGIS
ncbi:MAG: phospholipid carrier-dependent glycosyltransferase, partial [Chloroflexota bacterium]